MKKTMFAILACCSLLAAQANADVFSVLQETRVKTQQIASRNNLDNLFKTAAGYWLKNQKYPTLAELNLPNKTLANPYHTYGNGPQVPDQITKANCGYAYFGAVLNGTGAAIAAPTTTPLAFEKPSIRKDGKLLVLFASGKIESVELRAKTCVEVIEALKQKVEDPNALIWNRLVAAAKAIDIAK